MTAVVTHRPPTESTPIPDSTLLPAPADPVNKGRLPQVSWFKRPLWNRFTPLQLVVLTLATIAPLVIVGALGAGAIGIIPVDAMAELALAAGENPGMITFGAMFLASPMQWLTGRSQIRVRKYLGIVFFLLALSNAALFVLETGLLATVGAPFLIAGTIAVVLSAPLFLTSSRWAQRKMGMKNWRLLHKLTYLVAIGLLGHVILIGDIGPGAIMIALGLVARLPAVRRWISDRAQRRKAVRTSSEPIMSYRGTAG